VQLNVEFQIATLRRHWRHNAETLTPLLRHVLYTSILQYHFYPPWARSGLAISVNWTFFARCYGWGATSENRLKIGIFAPTWSVWLKISGRGRSPPTVSGLSCCWRSACYKAPFSARCCFCWVVYHRSQCRSYCTLICWRHAAPALPRCPQYNVSSLAWNEL